MAYSSHFEDDLTPIKETSHFKLSPEEIFYLKQLSPDELREKFIRVNEDFMTLKIFTRKQEDKITRLQTKLRKLTSDVKGKPSGEKGDSFRLLIIEHEEKVQLLESKISHLQMRNKNLEAKLRVANVQLCAAKRNKVPMLYRHITPRIDSGIKRSRISKSLTNIHQATENSSRIGTPSVRRSNSKTDYMSQERDSSNLSTPREEHESLDMSNQVRFILEEAKKRIMELEEDQEQLLQQLSEAQQTTEYQEREYGNKISSLEKELEKKSGECREIGIQEQKEKMAFIRSERQSRASSARMTALSNHLKDTEDKLKQERLLKDEAKETLALLKEEKNEKETVLKDLRFQNQKLMDEVQEIKTDDSYLKKQLKQLEAENQRLTELCVRDRKSSRRREESDAKIQNALNLLQGEKLDKCTSISEMGGRVNYTPSDRVSNDMTDLMTEISREREEKAHLIQEISKEKEKHLKALLEIEELKVLNKRLSDNLQKLSEEKNVLGNEESLNELKKSIEEYKQMDKGNIYDKMAFRELQNQYTELQLIYRQKKIELDKASSLLSGHADTYEHLQQEKRTLLTEIEKQSEETTKTINKFESFLKTKNDIISRLENQLVLSQPPTSDDVTKEEVTLETGETMSLHKHHNILELVIDKLNFSVPVDDKLKTFASWVMFVPLREPLQHTSVARGSPACFNHTSLYKFKMNYSNFFLIRDEGLRVNIHFLMENNHPRKIGECVISLEELLLHPHNSLHGTVNVEKFTENGQHELFKDSKESRDQENDSIGSLFYTIRFHKSGEEYLAKFRRKMAELKRSEQLSRKEGTVFTSNSTTSSPKSCPPPLKKDEVKISTDEKKSSSEIEQRLNESIEDAHETLHKSSSSSSSSSSSRKLEKDITGITGSRKSSVSNGNVSTYRSGTEVSMDKENNSENIHEETEKIDVEEQEEKIEETNKETIAETRKEKKTLKLSKQLLGVFRSKILVKDKVNEDSKNNSQVIKPTAKKRKLSLLGKSKALFSSSTLSTDGDINPEGKEERILKEEEKEKEEEEKLKEEDKDDEEDDSDDDEDDEDDGENDTNEDEDNDSDQENNNDNNTEDSDEENVSKSSESDSSISSKPEDDSSRNKLKTKEVVVEQKRDASKKPSADESDSEASSHSDDNKSRVTSTSESSSGSSTPKNDSKNGILRIEIVGLELEKNTQVIQDSSVEYLVVDYFGFLDLEPDSVETPNSLPKPKPGVKAYFNFVNDINLSKRAGQMLEKLQKQDAEIKFHLSSELQKEMHDDDLELGCATFKIRKMLNGFKGGIPILDLESVSKIGTLFIDTSFEA